jgi:hypothetical protein
LFLARSICDPIYNTLPSSTTPSIALFLALLKERMATKTMAVSETVGKLAIIDHGASDTSAELPVPIDPWRYITPESARRIASPLTGLVEYISRPGLISLGGGLFSTKKNVF